MPATWLRLHNNAYPQPLTLGDRQLIEDQRFMLRTLSNDRHLDIVGARKDDQGYYICKKGNVVRSSYNLTISSMIFHLKRKNKKLFIHKLSFLSS